MFETDLKLNLMISQRLADDYVMVNLFSFDYDLLQIFCSLYKNFLLVSFMNENEVFLFLFLFFLKKSQSLSHKIYIYIYFISVLRDFNE